MLFLLKKYLDKSGPRLLKLTVFNGSTGQEHKNFTYMPALTLKTYIISV